MTNRNARRAEASKCDAKTSGVDYDAKLYRITDSVRTLGDAYALNAAVTKSLIASIAIIAVTSRRNPDRLMATIFKQVTDEVERVVSNDIKADPSNGN